MDSKKFREALVKIMPGCKWTIHRSRKGDLTILATAKETSGFNRLSTLEVSYSSRNQSDWFEVKYFGNGTRGHLLDKNGDVTLARAVRGLQDRFQRKAAIYSCAAGRISEARIATSITAPAPDGSGA